MTVSVTAAPSAADGPASIRAEGYDILTDKETGKIKLMKAFDASPDA